jgi:hypothetical protein
MASELMKHLTDELDRQRELQHEREKREIREAPAESGPTVAPIVWTGTLRQLAELAIGQYKKKRIKANSEMDALKQFSKHFVRSDSGPIDPRSLWQNYKNKKDKDEGKS